MPEAKKRLLVSKVRSVIDSLDQNDVAMIVAMISGNEALRQQVLNEITTFLSTEFSMQVCHAE
jgi:uncharacterized protein YlxP (DUF503 family)